MCNRNFNMRNNTGARVCDTVCPGAMSELCFNSAFVSNDKVNDEQPHEVRETSFCKSVFVVHRIIHSTGLFQLTIWSCRAKKLNRSKTEANAQFQVKHRVQPVICFWTVVSLSPGGSPHNLSFRVKFFVTEPSKLQEEYTRWDVACLCLIRSTWRVPSVPDFIPPDFILFLQTKTKWHFEACSVWPFETDTKVYVTAHSYANISSAILHSI